MPGSWSPPTLHTQRATAEHLVSVKHADYLMTIKANQPRLLAATQQVLAGPATEFVEHIDHDRGHGRTEQRILRAAAVTPGMGIDFPHAAQVFRVIRHGQKSNMTEPCLPRLRRMQQPP